MESNKFPYKRFSHTECNYYPCHNIDYINCLFCFCPLYHIECPGNYSFTEKNIKDCSNCNWIHDPDNYDTIIKLLSGGQDG